MGKDNWNQLSLYNLTLLQLEQTTGSSGQRGTGPPTEPGFSHGFGSLPLSPLACLVGDTSFPAISSTLLHRYNFDKFVLQYQTEFKAWSKDQLCK